MSNTFDLNTMSRKELEQLRKDVDGAISTRAVTERATAIQDAQRAAAEHGFTLDELFGDMKMGKKAKSVRPAKFRDPQDSTNTWSGRGRKPRWFIEREEQGVPQEDMAI